MNPNFRLLTVLVLAMLPQWGLAQITDPTLSQPREYVIRTITVTGADVQTEAFVRASASLSEGDRIRVPGPQIGDAVRRIFRTGLFSEVNIYQTDVSGEFISLEIVVKEQPRLESFEISGVRRGQRRELREKLNLIPGFAVTDAVTAQAKSVIRRFYADKGYINTETIVKVARLDTLRNRVRLEFQVQPGDRVQIRQIGIEGNEAFSDRRVRRELKDVKSKTWWRLGRQSFDPAKYETALENLQTFYRKNGHRDFHLESDSVFIFDHKANKPAYGIRIRVSEGPKYHLREVSWEGNTVYTEEQLQNALAMAKGDVFNEEKFRSNLQANKNNTDVTSLYHDSGYLFFQIQDDIRTVPGDSIDVHFVIAEDEIAKVRQVTFSGNIKTNDQVVRRTLRSVPGQNYNRSAIIRTIRELATLGYFNPEKISPDLNPDFQNKTVDVSYGLDESMSTDNFEFSGGFGGRQFGVILSLRLNFNNFSAQNLFDRESWSPLPSGDGQKVSLGAQMTGSGYQNYSFSFLEPWFGGRPNSFGFGSSYSYYRFSSAQRYEQFSANVSYGRRLQWPDDYFTHTSILQYQWLTVNRREGFIEPGRSPSISLRQVLERNSLDNFISPTYGSKFFLSGELAPPLGVFQQYYKVTTGFQTHVPVVGKLVFTNGYEYGFLGWFGDKERSQFGRFYLGGTPLQQQQTFYRENIDLKGFPGGFGGAISPYVNGEEVGGTVYAKYYSELRYPAVTSEQVQIIPYLFAEAGNAYLGFRDFDPFEVKRASGLGVRLFLPILGLIDLSYGYRFDGVEGSQLVQPGRWEFLFNIGAPF